MARLEPSEVVKSLAASKAARDRTASDAGAHRPWTDRLKSIGHRHRSSDPAGRVRPR